MKRNHEWGYSTTNKCTICMKQMEDRQHILTCKDPIAKAYRDKLIIGLRTDLYKIQTSPFIVNHLIRERGWSGIVLIRSIETGLIIRL